MAKAHRSREGEVLAGKYRLESLLGAGGMGEVYRAENVALGRMVAIKVLREEYGESSEVVMRFLREARAASLVRHPNVVDVLDVAQAEDGTPFIVQELLEGEDLASYVHRRGGRVPVREAAELLLPALDAVGFAHGRGVIHRDLKPENIFLARDATGAIVPKLLDFGISRIVTAEEQRMTATGMSIGTPAYMSPEQIRADKVIDAHTDVWSMGVILHEIVAGALPFQAESHSSLFVKIVTEPPIPLTTALPGVPAQVAAVVERCLKPRQSERYASAGDVAAALRAFLAGGGPQTAPHVAGVAPAPPVAHASVPTEPRMVDASGVPDLMLPAPKAKPSRAPAAPSRPAPAPAAAARKIVIEDGDFAGEIVPLSDRRLELAADPAMYRHAPAQRVARATQGLRTDVEHEPDVGSGRLLGMGVMWVLVLALTAVLMLTVPAGWPVVSWATNLDGMPVWASGSAAGVLIALGVAAIVVGGRADPISWGLIVAAPGLVADGLVLAGFAVHELPSLTGSGGLDALERILFPWPTTLVFVGLCIVALRRAWWAWSKMGPGRASNAAVGLVLAALALFGAVQVVRGVEPAPAASSLAS